MPLKLFCNRSSSCALTCAGEVLPFLAFCHDCQSIILALRHSAADGGCLKPRRLRFLQAGVHQFCRLLARVPTGSSPRLHMDASIPNMAF